MLCTLRNIGHRLIVLHETALIRLLLARRLHSKLSIGVFVLSFLLLLPFLGNLLRP